MSLSRSSSTSRDTLTSDQALCNMGFGIAACSNSKSSHRATFVSPSLGLSDDPSIGETKAYALEPVLADIQLSGGTDSDTYW